MGGTGDLLMCVWMCRWVSTLKRLNIQGQWEGQMDVRRVVEIQFNVQSTNRHITCTELHVLKHHS